VLIVAEWITVASTGDVPEGEMIGATVDGVDLLVANVGGQYRAIGAVCTHEGGPLADGDLYDGIVTCPWHGSEFNVETGEVETPPATEPQSVYEVRVEGDEIQVAKPGG
jgi:nitrite reductase/ring-hydroxylating ferredoxin subunit